MATFNNLGSGINDLANEVDEEITRKGQARLGNHQAINEFAQYDPRLRELGYDLDSVKNSDQAIDLWKGLFNEWNTKYPDNESWNYEKANKLWNDEGWQEKSNLLEKLADYWYSKEWEEKAPYGRYGDANNVKPYKPVK